MGVDDFSVTENIRRVYDDLFDQEAKVADFILKNPDQVAKMTVSDLASAVGVSDATVMRLSKKVGYKGFYHLKLSLSQKRTQETASKNPNIKTDAHRNFSVINKLINEDINDLSTLQNTLDERRLLQAVQVIKRADQIYLFASSNSNTLASYATYLLSQLGIKAIHSSMVEMQINYVNQMTLADAAIFISSSGSTKSINNLAKQVSQANIQSIAITRHVHTPLVQYASSSLIVPEVQRNDVPVNLQLGEFELINIIITLLCEDESAVYRSAAQQQEKKVAQFKD